MPKAHWLDYVKEAAVKAVKSEKPCDYIVGTVASIKPLKIKLSDGDGVEIGAAFIHLARNVTDFELTLADGASLGVRNALEKGERVLLVRKWGGQDYVVVDRVVS